MDPHTQRAEAERWLGIAAKLMTARDFLGSKTFAMRAREADPNNPVSDQILAVIETILAGEKRVNASQQPDWYSILQLPRLARDPDQIADHYRRLVMCLNPERNRFPFADYALQLVMDAWSVLSDPTKKWLFDNELQMFSHQNQQQQQPQPQQQQQTDASAAAAAAAAGGGQLNTFQFFQQQPQQPPQPQPQQPPQQQQQPMWQLQQPQQQQHQHHHPQQQQINQREFMPLPQVQPQPQSSQQQQLPQHHQQLPPQWQMRDPTPIKSGGERNKQVLNGIGGVTSSNIPTPMIPTQSASTPTTMRPVPQAPPPAPPPVPQPQPQQKAPAMAARVTVAAVGNVVAGNAGIVPTTTANNNDNNNNIANDNNNNNNNDDDDVNVNDSNVNGVGEDNDDEGGVEEGDRFWTACPYCFYIYQYQKVYQECTLRCQNCRKGFHAVQIPNPPPVSTSKEKEKDKEKEKGKDNEKEKENAFCCWGFFPLGFSMTAWKKQQNQGGNANGSNWVPFSPMFTSPVANGGGGFQWFDNGGGNAFVGPKHAATKNTPRVYIDDEVEDVLELSESSDMDSSDADWRTYNQDKTKTKGKKRRRRRGNVGGRRKGRPPKNDVVKQVTQNVASGGGVSVGGEELADGATNAQEVVFSLAAGDKSNSSKTIPATLTRKQTRRSVKDVGRLDLNVEFNNDGEEHAPAVSAVNGEEDGIENIAFFDGLDEFLSTLPILNVGGDEKAKPS